VAERSGDTAFDAGETLKIFNPLCVCESGVALRFPPQSKKSRLPSRQAM
jgi:hypothetical protein